MKISHCLKCSGSGYYFIETEPLVSKGEFWERTMHKCDECGGTGHLITGDAGESPGRLSPVPAKEWPTGDGQRPSVTPAPVGVADIDPGVFIPPPSSSRCVVIPSVAMFAEGGMKNGAFVVPGTTPQLVREATDKDYAIGRAYHLSKPPEDLGGWSHAIAAGDPVRFEPLPKAPKEGGSK
jgi:hypothetical protein